MHISNKSARQKDLREILRREKRRLQDSINAELAPRVNGEHSAAFQEALDTGDMTFYDVLETIGFKVIDIRQEELAKLVEAERKLKEGSYGTCELCGREISARRLTAVPYAVYCLECAEKVEGDKVHGKGPSL